MLEQSCLILPGTVRDGDALGGNGTARLERDCAELRRMVAKLPSAGRAVLAWAIAIAKAGRGQDGHGEP